MDLYDFFEKTDLEHSFIIGYYGGSNFGDELLLEIIQNILKTKGVKDSSFYYSDIESYETYHHTFGYKIIPPTPRYLLKAILKSNSIIVGGGGLWGLDFNKNVAILSILLFITRFFLRKKVYLVGIGSYSSIPYWGHFFSKIAALSANKIYARDKESCLKLKKTNKGTYLSSDLASYLPNLDLSKYGQDLEKNKLAELIKKFPNSLIFSTRHFSNRHSQKVGSSYNNAIENVVATINRPVILLLLNSRKFDPESYMFYKKLENKYANVVGIFEANFNPIILYMMFNLYGEQIHVISPQYHMQMLAHLTKVKFTPICYDNKNREFYDEVGIKNWIDISKATPSILIESVSNTHQ